MKAIFNKFSIVGLAAMVFAFSCKKDEVKALLTSPTGNVINGFTSSSATIATLKGTTSGGNDSTNVVTFSWPAVNYGAQVAVTYALQFDTPSDTSGATGWSAATSVSIPAKILTKSFLGADFNQLLYQQMQLQAGKPTPIVVRLKADVNQGGGYASAIKSVYSNVIPLAVTCYQIIVVYPLFNVPGSYQGWNPADSTPGSIITDSKGTGSYEGYIYVVPGDQFKFANGSWAKNWGSTAAEPAPLTGTLKSGASNVGGTYITTAGIYKVNMDINALTYSVTLTNWALIGDFNTWTADAPMTYNAATKVLTASVNFGAGGGFKFRANGAWTIQFGMLNGRISGAGSAGNITAPSGTHVVTLDLSRGDGNYTFGIL